MGQKPHARMQVQTRIILIALMFSLGCGSGAVPITLTSAVPSLQPPTAIPTAFSGVTADQPLLQPATAVSTSTIPPSMATALPPTFTPLPSGMEVGQVVRIIDGDTIDVNLNGTEMRVRYIGMNTPETNELCGSTATNANATLVANQQVTLLKDISETDQYGRLLRYVYVGSLFINAELVRQGYARAATYPPDVAHADEFSQLESQARANNLGCWSTSVWVPLTDAPQPTSAPTGGSTDGGGPSGVCDCSGPDLDCGDFSNHASAQACHDDCQSQGFGDVFGLDREGDGNACESLP